MGHLLHFSEPLFNNRPWVVVIVYVIYYSLLVCQRLEEVVCKKKRPWKLVISVLISSWSLRSTKHDTRLLSFLSCILAPPSSPFHSTPSLQGSLKISKLYYYEEQFHFLNPFHKLSFWFTFAKPYQLRYSIHNANIGSGIHQTLQEKIATCILHGWRCQLDIVKGMWYSLFVDNPCSYKGSCKIICKQFILGVC